MDFQDDDRKQDSPLMPTTLPEAHSHERNVNASEFLTLALSSRKLWRHDDTMNGRLGLLDPHTGERILTPGSQFDRLVSGGETKPSV